ncbi:SpoIIE family protein phosphatase [Streptomyces minutiscleroticus]|uniref:SpoIIE family protein phosphatase n=1 Tax=Streptomyces minutiscleroticus TaxID=68238 RepID=UPI003D9ED18C
MTRTSLPGNPLAPGAARRFVRAVLADWTRLAVPGADGITDRLAEDASVVVSELVTNAVVHAGTDVDLLCRLEESEEPPEGPDARDGTGGPRAPRAPGAPGAPGAPDGADAPGARPAETAGVPAAGRGAFGALVVEVADRHPARSVRDGGEERPYDMPEYGRGLHLVADLSEEWGITYRTGTKTVWARLPLARVPPEPEDPGPPEATPYPGQNALRRGLRVAELLAPAPRQGVQDPDWLNRGALTFLAEASDLLAGQLDEDLIAALTGQLLVPRLADWCAVWLDQEAAWGGAHRAGAVAGARLARVWHGSENRIGELRRVLERTPPVLPDAPRGTAIPVPWPAEALGGHGAVGAALAYRLVAGGQPVGTLVIGRAGLLRFPDEITGLVEDFSRRVALAVGTARQYARQATISRVLQRGLLPGAVADIPGLQSALVYEPCDKGGPSGDFYDLFPAGDGRWCFALGDVQGKGPEAAVVIGLARPWLRLLAREGYAVPDVLDRLNQLLLDDATEVSNAAARALAAAGGQGVGELGQYPQSRFLSLVYGELVPFDGGVRCTLASAGHPLPLVLQPDGKVRDVVEPQTLLGAFEEVAYTCETFELRSGESLLCVTDGVTERRDGQRLFDDEDGLAAVLTECAGLGARLVADRIRRLVHAFGAEPPEDDLALLVLQAE